MPPFRPESIGQISTFYSLFETFRPELFNDQRVFQHFLFSGFPQIEFK